MAKGSKDPLEGMKLAIIPGRADEKGTAQAGVQVTKKDLKADLWFRVDEQGIRFQYLQLFGGDIDSSAIRLPLTAIKKWAVKQIRKRPHVMSIGAFFGDAGQKAAVESAFQLLTKSEPGQTVRNDEHWSFIADLYLYCCQVYGSEPIVGMKLELEKRQMFWSRSKVANEKKRAVQLDWLASSTKGKVNCEPGPKLIARRKEQRE